MIFILVHQINSKLEMLVVTMFYNPPNLTQVEPIMILFNTIEEKFPRVMHIFSQMIMQVHMEPRVNSSI